MLNAEQSKSDEVAEKLPHHHNSDSKKVDDLERTVFIMKRVVEKLQAENKKLLNGKKPIPEKIVS